MTERRRGCAGGLAGTAEPEGPGGGGTKGIS